MKTKESPTKSSKSNKPAVRKDAPPDRVRRAVRERLLDEKEKYDDRLPEADSLRRWVADLDWHLAAVREIALRLAERPPADEVSKRRNAMEQHLYQIGACVMHALEEIEVRKEGR